MEGIIKAEFVFKHATEKNYNVNAVTEIKQTENGDFICELPAWDDEKEMKDRKIVFRSVDGREFVGTNHGDFFVISEDRKKFNYYDAYGRTKFLNCELILGGDWGEVMKENPLMQFDND